MRIPYTPDKWTPEQLAFHRAPDLDAAFHAASCLAGGWYRRSVTIGVKIVDLDEFYAIAPTDAPLPEGFRPTYRVEAVRDDR